MSIKLSKYVEDVYSIVDEDEEIIGRVIIRNGRAEIDFWDGHDYNLYLDGKIECLDYDYEYEVLDDREVRRETWTTTIYKTIDFYSECPDNLYKYYHDIMTLLKSYK